MKPNPKTSPMTSRTRTDDHLGQGMDAALTVLAFIGIGFALDRWLGTAPLLMVGMFVLAAVGVFVSYRYRYEATMARLEDERLARRRGSAP